MRVLLTDEQELLSDTVTQLAAQASRPFVEHVLRQPATDAPEASIATLGDLGLNAIRAAGDDEDELGAIEVAVVCEALGRSLSPWPYIGTAVMPAALLSTSPEAAHRVSDAAAGTPVGVALGRQLADLAAGTPTSASGGIALDAAGAGLALRRVDDTLALTALMPTVASGHDPTRRTASVDPSATAERLGPAPTREWRALPRIALCADMVGVMAGALELAVEHARQRMQFDRPIGSFQAVQQLCAAQYVDVEASRSITYHAAWSFDRRPKDEADAAARRAFVYVTAAARRVTEAAIQVNGGIGITWEAPLHLHLRRVLFDASLLGPRRALLAIEARRFALA